MRIFMSYASEQKAVAEAIAFSLRSRGHLVFLDRDDLPEGSSYDDKIATAVDRSDLMIFLISPQSVAEGRYTLTELRYARYKWRSPSNRVLPVMLEPTPIADIPAYLKAVSILEPHGNKAAEVAFAVERQRGFERAITVAALTSAIALPFAFVEGLLPVLGGQARWEWLRGTPLEDLTTVFVGIPLAALFVALYWWLGDRKWWKAAIVAVAALAGWIGCVFVGANFEIMAQPPDSELDQILRAVPEAQRTELAQATEKLKKFLGAASTTARQWSQASMFGLKGLVCFLPIYAGLALVDPSFRSLNRLIVGAFFATLAGAAGSLLMDLAGSGTGGDFEKVLWFVERVDLQFALLYLPWLVAIPAACAYWMIRGQER